MYTELFDHTRSIMIVSIHSSHSPVYRARGTDTTIYDSICVRLVHYVVCQGAAVLLQKVWHLALVLWCYAFILKVRILSMGASFYGIKESSIHPPRSFARFGRDVLFYE